MKANDLTQEQLKALVHYDPLTGIFIRLKKCRCSNRVGKAVGTLGVGGYMQAQVGGVRCMLHRLAFLYMTGAWPNGDVDHIDGRPANNRWTNLRDVSKSVNLQNRKGPTKLNKSGFLGVHKKRNRWTASIALDGRNIHLGCFNTPEAASEAYLAAKRAHHEGCTL